MLFLNVLKEEDVFKDLSRLFDNNGPIDNKALKPWLFYDEGALVSDRSNVYEFRYTLHGNRFHTYNLVLLWHEIYIHKKVCID